MSSPESEQASHSLRLRERLKAIQQNRKQTKSKSASTPVQDVPEPCEQPQSSTEDNLMLRTFSSAQPGSEAGGEESGVSEKELAYYQGLVARLQTENSQLKRGVEDKDREFRKSQEALQAMGAGIAGVNIAGRIVELSRRVRELQSELYSEQSKVKRLETGQLDLQELVKLRERELEEVRAELESNPPEETSPSHQKKLDALREEVAELKARVMEGKNASQSLRQELRLTQKALSQELGADADKYSLSQIINSDVSWKGRAQQIKLLKKKINELRSQIQSMQVQEDGNRCSHLDTEMDGINTAVRFDSHNSIQSIATSRTSTSVPRQLDSSCQGDRQRDLIKKMESSRREATERTQEELEELRRSHTESKHKCNALQARNQTLSQEVKQLRKDLTETLSREKNMKETISKLSSAPPTAVSKYQATIEGLKQELNKKDVEVENLSQELSSRESHLTLPSIYPHREMCTEGSAPARRTRGRHATSAPGVSTCKPLNHSEALDTASLNAQLQSASVERDKLRELVGLLQERLEEAVEASSSQAAQLRQMKQSSALMEKEISRCAQTGTARSVRVSDAPGGLEDQLSSESLLQRVEIAQDEILALQHRLSSVTQSRKEDTRLYREMLDASRDIFTDTLNQLKSAGVDREHAS